ncbi:MAG: hypothetical protein M3N16_08650, partial [Actinomycetota bacterium]|nr:hypothetical protein [Actinomycetota bacterium]
AEPPPEAAPAEPPPGPYARAEARNAAARAALVPLAPGERPRAVTVAALVAVALVAVNVALYLLDPRPDGGGARPPLIAGVAYSILLLVTAWGLWRARAWAVLGVQAALVLVIALFSLLVLRAEDPFEAVLALAVIGAAGTLFTYLVKAMARIQMPR